MSATSGDVRMSKSLRFTIRDWFWLVLMVALLLTWRADRRYYVGASSWQNQTLFEEKRRLYRDYASKVEIMKEIEAQYVAEKAAAVDRELDLRTTVNALELRLKTLSEAQQGK
jgi:hypothetical protein